MSKNEEYLSMNITVGRRHIEEEDPNVAWGECQKVLTPFESPDDGSLIEDSQGCLQVDFANAYIGGGVLSMGNVQVNCTTKTHLNCYHTVVYVLFS